MFSRSNNHELRIRPNAEAQSVTMVLLQLAVTLCVCVPACQSLYLAMMTTHGAEPTVIKNPPVLM